MAGIRIKNSDINLSALVSVNSGIISHTTKLVLIWLATGSAAFFIALMWLPSIYVDGQFIPAGVDSFYHARRILDVVNNSTFFQFDPRIHSPEGGLLTWPWAYDYFIAHLVIVIKFVFNISSPVDIITFIPPAWSFVNVAILLAITSLLNFPLTARLVAALCFALIPLTQELHGAGRIDHHFMELTMVLLTLLGGLYWFRKNASTRSSILFGIVLGFSPGINNGLFVLQIPVILTLFWLWPSNKLPNSKSVAMLCASLMLSTAMLLLPSVAFQQGLSSYYYLSWFHLYVSCSSAFVMSFISYFKFTKKTLVTLAACCMILIMIIIPQLVTGSDFLFAKIQTYNNIPETASIAKQITKFGLLSITSTYTALLFLAPCFLFYLVYVSRKKVCPHLLFTIVSCVFGFLLLCFQLRLNYFGSIALYIPLLIIFTYWLDNPSLPQKYLWTGLIVLLVFSYLPTLSYYTRQIPTGRSFDYALTRGIYPAMNMACRTHPGVVLADYGVGNYIRYHSECSVIANNMVITSKDIEKVLFTEKLMTKTARQISLNFPWIQYVFVMRNDNIMSPQSVEAVFEQNRGLREELLLHGKTFPDGYSLVKELAFRQPNGSVIPFARLFEIQR